METHFHSHFTVVFWASDEGAVVSISWGFGSELSALVNDITAELELFPTAEVGEISDTGGLGRLLDPADATEGFTGVDPGVRGDL